VFCSSPEDENRLPKAILRCKPSGYSDSARPKARRKCEFNCRQKKRPEDLLLEAE
jgi:hypothetical protein